MAYSFLSDNPDPVIRESESLVEIISKRAKLQPESVVYRYLGDGVNETESFTFKEIDRVARSVAQALSEKLNKGDRVLLLFPQGLQYVAALYGCFYGGFIAIPAYPPRRNRKMDRINSIIEEIDKAICPPSVQNIAVVGIGQLGKAVINYIHERSSVLKIKAAFDNNPDKIGRTFLF